MTTLSATADASAIERRRRRQILRVVARVVAEEGFDGATMRKIADTAGVSTGMLTYYYKNKRDLIMDMVQDAYQRFSRHITDQVGESEGSATVIAALDEMLEGSRSGFFPFSFWLAFWAEAVRDPELREFSHRSPLWAVFRRALQAGVAAGELRPDLDVDLAADLIMLVTQGARVSVGLAELPEERVSQAVRLLLGYMAK